MSDEQALDADPWIPTGVDATAEQVAELLANDLLPVEAVDKLPERQRPDTKMLTDAAADSKDGSVTALERLAPLLDTGVTPTVDTTVVDAKAIV